MEKLLNNFCKFWINPKVHSSFDKCYNINNLFLFIFVHGQIISIIFMLGLYKANRVNFDGICYKDQTMDLCSMYL